MQYKQVFTLEITWFLPKETMKQAWHTNENSGLAKQAAQRLEFSSLFAGSTLPC